VRLQRTTIPGLGFALCLATVLGGVPEPAPAFDYLEHSYLTDRACFLAQTTLGKLLSAENAGAPDNEGHEFLAIRYLALSLLCPLRWDKPYCNGGYKQAASVLHGPRPAEGQEYAITLGDLAALPDHLPWYGRIGGLPRAEDPGVIDLLLEWLEKPPGGMVEDVAEDACETGDELPWSELDRGLATDALALVAHPEPALSAAHFAPNRRRALLPGPHDPAGAYSFDNPQYLDMVLTHYHHFGAEAYASWVGFQHAARSAAETPCTALLLLSAEQAEDLSGPNFSEELWEASSESARRDLGCRLLAARLTERVLQWRKSADPGLTGPVVPWVDRLAQEQDAAGELGLRLASAFLSLPLCGSGLHFLQDNLSGGHLRTRPYATRIEETRRRHDHDSAVGVVAIFHGHPAFASPPQPFLAFGDGYLLGPGAGGRSLEEGLGLGQCIHHPPEDPETATNCLLRYQRALILASTAAALRDWASILPRGKYFEERHSLGRFLLSRPVDLVSLSDHLPYAMLHIGDLPVPWEPLSYQALVFAYGIELRARGLVQGFDLSLLSALGREATWLSGYHLGARVGAVDGPNNRLLLAAGYGFHWRWAARFLLDLVPLTFLGLGDGSDRGMLTAGLDPAIGLSVLPEGWIKFPLQVSLTGRLPTTFLDSTRGLVARGVLSPWLELAVGLAYF